MWGAVFAWPIANEEGSYDFDWDQDGSHSQVDQLHYADVKVGPCTDFHTDNLMSWSCCKI
jgi:hypothetical protein